MSSEAQTGRRRILLVIAGLGAGGAERQMALLVRTIDRDRYDVGLLIFNAEERVHYREVFEKPLWFRALSLSSKHAGPVGLAIGMARGIRRAVADFKPDLIHTSLHVANVMVRITSLLCCLRIPVVTSIRSDFLHGYPKFAQFTERVLCRHSAAIIANAESTRQQLLATLPLPASRVVTIENGIDPSFSPGQSQAPAGWPLTGRVALVVGRFAADKNHLALIEALKVLDLQGQLGDWSFALVGEGPLCEPIEAAAANFSRIRLFPPTNDLLPFYRNADLLLLPSLREGLPNVALEAQACGVPVALTPGANASGAVADGFGWVLEGDLVSALLHVLNAPLDEYHLYRDMALIDVHKRFGVEQLLKNTYDVYDLVLGGGAP